MTQLGGADSWLALLRSSRPGVAGRDAVAWRTIVQNVNAMMIPGFVDAAAA